jgi:hypothetical protein
MAACDVCGNDYDKTMEITVSGTSHVFAIIGHGHEAGGSMYCCAHCAQQQGHPKLTDRVDA